MNQLIEDDKRFVWHPFTQHQDGVEPIPIVRAEGTLLYDVNDQSYIDANSSWWVNVHGHGHPHIEKALTDQFKQLDHVVFAGVTHPKAVEFAKRISGHLPEDLNRTFYSDNGSTAAEVALKLAFQYWFNRGEERRDVLALHGSYHGDTFGAMSVGARGYFNKPFESFFFHVNYLDFPVSDNEERILKRAMELLGSGSFASVIVEPLVQGAAGMRMYSASFLDQLISIAKKNDVIVIFDEVMTGFGRTGKLFAMDHCTNKPDIVAMSKGLTAGVMALGVTVATDRIFEAFLDDEIGKAFLHGHSFTANPLACAVACANLDVFEEEDTWDHIAMIRDQHRIFASKLSSMPMVKNVRQTGTILAFEVQDDSDSYFSDIKTKAYKYFLEKGILLRPLGNTIFFNPPFCITELEYDYVQKAIIQFLSEL